MKLWMLSKEGYDKDEVIYLLTTDKFKVEWMRDVLVGIDRHRQRHRDELNCHDHGGMGSDIYEDIRENGEIKEITSLDQVCQDHWDWLINIADEIPEANDGDDISIREVFHES